MLALATKTSAFTLSGNMETDAAHFQKALELIGRFREKQTTPGGDIILKGSTRYGLQKVPLMIELKKDLPGSTNVLITGKSDDRKGVAATSCIDRLQETYHVISAGDEKAIALMSGKGNFQATIGFTPGKIFLRILMFMIIFLVIFYAINALIKFF